MVWQAKGSCQMFYFDAIEIQTEEEAFSTNISLSFPCCPLSVVGTYASRAKQTESHLVFSGLFCFGIFGGLFSLKKKSPFLGENEVSKSCFNHKIAVIRKNCMLGLMMSLLKVKYYSFNFLRFVQVSRIYFHKFYIQLWFSGFWAENQIHLLL